MAQIMTASRNEKHNIIDWKAGAWAGVIAGLVFVMLEMGMVWMIQGQSPWGPPHLIAAMLLGNDVLPPPGTWAPFDLKILMTAMMIHLPLSVVYGLIGAWLLHRFDGAVGVMIGAGFGLAIYVVNFYVVAPALFPWFEMGRNWIGVVSHLMFGAVLAGAYLGLRKSNTMDGQRR